MFKTRMLGSTIFYYIIKMAGFYIDLLLIDIARLYINYDVYLL